MENRETCTVITSNSIKYIRIDLQRSGISNITFDIAPPPSHSSPSTSDSSLKFGSVAATDPRVLERSLVDAGSRVIERVRKTSARAVSFCLSSYATLRGIRVWHSAASNSRIYNNPDKGSNVYTHSLYVPFPNFVARTKCFP